MDTPNLPGLVLRHTHGPAWPCSPVCAVTQAYLVHGAFAFILYTYGAVSGALGYYGACVLEFPCSELENMPRSASAGLCCSPCFVWCCPKPY